MAVTHADLAPTRTRGADITGVILMIFSILLGLLCFVLCLIAEATRSQIVGAGEVSGSNYTASSSSSCRYSGDGKTALISAGGAFLSLAVGVVMQHTHLLLSLTKSPDHELIIITHNHQPLTCQAAFFFITTWICFSIGEVLLLIGLSAESGHLKGWLTPRPHCFVVPEGLFSSAGVLGITTVFLALGLSITALRAQWLLPPPPDQQRHAPSPSPNQTITVAAAQAPVMTHHDPGLIDYLRAFDKII